MTHSAMKKIRMASSVRFMRGTSGVAKYSAVFEPQQDKGQDHEENHDAIKNHLRAMGFLLQLGIRGRLAHRRIAPAASLDDNVIVVRRAGSVPRALLPPGKGTSPAHRPVLPRFPPRFYPAP